MLMFFVFIDLIGDYRLYMDKEKKIEHLTNKELEQLLKKSGSESDCKNNNGNASTTQNENKISVHANTYLSTTNLSENSVSQIDNSVPKQTFGSLQKANRNPKANTFTFYIDTIFFKCGAMFKREIPKKPNINTQMNNNQKNNKITKKSKKNDKKSKTEEKIK